MVLGCTGEVLDAQAILDGQHQLPPRMQVVGDGRKVRGIRTILPGPKTDIFQYADYDDDVVSCVLRQVVEHPHEDIDVLEVPGPFSGNPGPIEHRFQGIYVSAGLAEIPGQCAATCTHFEHA